MQEVNEIAGMGKEKFEERVVGLINIFKKCD